MSKIKIELEDLALKYLDPVAYEEIRQSINQKKDEREKYIRDIMDVLREKLDQMDIKSQVTGRAKHFYSIFRKMYTQNKTIDELYDLFAVRIIVDTVADCYAVLGMVHDLYTPVPMRFKDYIAMPKPNMYQSLHTTVIGPNGTPFEIQFVLGKCTELPKTVSQHTGSTKKVYQVKPIWIQNLNGYVNCLIHRQIL